jgi:hypothetical protein
MNIIDFIVNLTQSLSGIILAIVIIAFARRSEKQGGTK